MGEDKSDISILQINLDRGKAATTLTERKFFQEFDIACIQEPYVNFIQTENYNRHKVEGLCKAEIWTKRNLRVTTLRELTTANYVTIKLEQGEDVHITSIYEEPGGGNCPRLNDLARRLGVRHSRHILAGDLNAHNAAWGEDETTVRGTEVLAWANMEGYEINNDRDMGPTFQTVRGQSYIDLTMSKRVEMRGWTVDEEETLSGHRYIQYKIKVDGIRAERPKMAYDFVNTDWVAYKRELRRQLDLTINNAMDIEEKAANIQRICRQVCQRKIARREINIRRDKEWFDEELRELRSQARGARRIWQLNKTEDNKRIYINKRNDYNKEVKRKKQTHITKELDELVEHDPWAKVWRLIGKKKTFEPKKNYRMENGQYTQTDDETNEYLLKKYFPTDEQENDTDEMRIIRNEQITYTRKDEPIFCLEELASIVRKLRKRKATPASDRVPNEAVKHIIEVAGEILLDIYRECWEKGQFPKIWKNAEIRWIPKKDGTPRPISLLPTLGKSSIR